MLLMLCLPYPLRNHCLFPFGNGLYFEFLQVVLLTEQLHQYFDQAVVLANCIDLQSFHSLRPLDVVAYFFVIHPDPLNGSHLVVACRKLVYLNYLNLYLLVLQIHPDLFLLYINLYRSHRTRQLIDFLMHLFLQQHFHKSPIIPLLLVVVNFFAILIHPWLHVELDHTLDCISHLILHPLLFDQPFLFLLVLIFLYFHQKHLEKQHGLYFVVFVYQFLLSFYLTSYLLRSLGMGSCSWKQM